MRDATKEERESIDNYIKSISHTIDDEVDLPIKHESKPYLMIPFPNGATNGDMIKALFPDCEFEDNSLNSERFDNTTSYLKFKGNMFTMAVEDAWWNAPYEKGGSK